MPSPTYIEMEARLDTVEARTDTKIERLGGKIDTMISTFNLKMEGIASALSESKQETRESARVTVVTTVGSAIAVIAVVVTVIFGMAMYGDAWFGRGLDMRRTIDEAIRETQKLTSTVAPAPMQSVPIPAAPATPPNPK